MPMTENIILLDAIQGQTVSKKYHIHVDIHRPLGLVYNVMLADNRIITL